MLRLFIQFELQKIVKYFKTKTVAKTIITGLFFSIFLLISLGVYHFFDSSFLYIKISAEENIRQALSLFLYEVFLIILSGLIIFSSSVSFIFNVFKSKENNWILSSPLYKIFPKMIFIKGLINSLLPLIILCLPAIIALHNVYHFSTLGLFSMLFSTVIFLILLHSLTIFSITFVTFIFYIFSKKTKLFVLNFKKLITIFIFLITILGIALFRIFKKIDLLSLFKSAEINQEVSISAMANHFTFLPSHPLAMEIMYSQIGDYKNALLSALVLIILSILFFILAWKTLYLFYPVWQQFQEGNAQKNKFASHSPLKNTNAFYFRGNTIKVLLKKEMLISTRNLKGVVWFFFLLFIWLLQISANLILDHNIQKHGHDITEKIITLQIIDYCIAVYFISSFALRFVFPSFSTERKTSWILASAPITFKQIFFGKFAIYAPFFVVLGIIMNYINSVILKLPLLHSFYSTTLLSVTILFIITVALSIGAVFPSRDTDDPEAASTSISGLFFTAISLIYGTTSSYILYLTLKDVNIFIPILFIMITVIMTSFILYKTPKYKH